MYTVMIRFGGAHHALVCEADAVNFPMLMESITEMVAAGSQFSSITIQFTNARIAAARFN